MGQTNMTLAYKFENDVSEMADAFDFKPHLMDKLQNTKPQQAQLFDLAFSAMRNNDGYNNLILEVNESSDLDALAGSLGLPTNVNVLTWSPVPMITLRSWKAERPKRFSGALLGLQRLIIEGIKASIGAKQYEQALSKSGMATDETAITQMYLANAKGTTTLLRAI